MARVVHFDLQADNPERTAEFLRQAFGWEVTKWEGPMDYWLIMTGPQSEPGIDGGLSKREGGYAPVTLAVTDLEEALAAVKAAGGAVAMAPEPIPGVGMLATITDPEGNIIGLLQPEAGSM